MHSIETARNQGLEIHKELMSMMLKIYGGELLMAERPETYGSSKFLPRKSL